MKKVYLALIVAVLSSTAFAGMYDYGYSNDTTYMQIGNSVPPLMGRRIAYVIKNILKEFHIPESYLSKRVYELSGGEQQRICIARAFSVEPKFITLDESLSGQDPIIRKELENAGIMHILVEVDQQMTNFEQAKTALQTFADMI